MSIQELTAGATPFPIGPVPHRFTVERYHEMIEKGILTTNDRVELIEGHILEISPIGGPHGYTVEELYDVCKAMLPPGWKVSSQRPVTLPGSEPQPDLSIVRGTSADYRNRHATPSEIALLIEVADSSLATDRLLKSRVYATAGVPEYWIVNLPERQIEVYRNPRQDRAGANYESRQVFSASENVPLALGGEGVGEIAVQKILP
jgi:Uma2 family endonuclease